jgi:hypothetical protein
MFKRWKDYLLESERSEDYRAGFRDGKIYARDRATSILGRFTYDASVKGGPAVSWLAAASAEIARALKDFKNDRSD